MSHRCILLFLLLALSAVLNFQPTVGKESNIKGRIVIDHTRAQGNEQTQSGINTDDSGTANAISEHKPIFKKGWFIVEPSAMKRSYQPFYVIPRLHSPFWRPTAPIIDEMEVRLREYLQSPEVAHRLGGQIPDDYWRQYLGCTSDAPGVLQVGDRLSVTNHRLIFISGFCTRSGSSDSDLKNRVFEVCDGGSCFWQLIYDVDTHEFANFSVNGV